MSIFPRFCLLATMLFLLLTLGVNPAKATVQLKAQFKATQACEAFQSFRKRTNPGNIRLIPEQIYPVIGKNKEEATHYYLEIDGVEPAARWVSLDCGQLLAEEDSLPNPANLLAISWQPSFCETHQDKSECETQTEARFDASNFTLHGLWPEPQYCNVSNDLRELDKRGQWSDLPAIELSNDLLQELTIKMPGVASDLHLHEWYKHGTCYSSTPEEYYRESLALLDQVNNSTVRNLFVENIEEEITSSEIRARFDDAFGDGAGERVFVSCIRDDRPTRRRMIVELKLNLKGDIESDTLIADLFKQGKIVGAGCSLGEVDRVGFD